MTANADMLVDLHTVKGRRLRIWPFPHAPLVNISVGNHKHSPGSAIVLNVAEARAARAALDTFLELVDQRGVDTVPPAAEIEVPSS